MVAGIPLYDERLGIKLCQRSLYGFTALQDDLYRLLHVAVQPPCLCLLARQCLFRKIDFRFFDFLWFRVSPPFGAYVS